MRRHRQHTGQAGDSERVEPGGEREERGDGELNMGRRGEIYFKLGTQVRGNRRRDGKGD